MPIAVRVKKIHMGEIGRIDRVGRIKHVGIVDGFLVQKLKDLCHGNL